MKASLLIIFIILTINSFAQKKKLNLIKPTNENIEFINEFFFHSIKFNKNTIYKYQPKLNLYHLDQKLELFAEDSVSSLYSFSSKKPIKRKQFLILTCDERRFIKEEIQKFDSLKWGKNLIPGEKRLSIAKSVTGGFSITKPIFLRDNTLCIFDYFYECGTRCAEGETTVFKKIDGKWERWMVVYRMVS